MNMRIRGSGALLRSLAMGTVAATALFCGAALAAIDTVVPALQSGALDAGMSGLLGQLRRQIAQDPAMVAQPEAARELATAVAAEIGRFPLANASHYGAAGAVIAGAAPQGQREAVAAAVMNVLVQSVGPDQRAAVQSQVIAAVSDVAGMSPEKATEKLKEEAARQPIRRPEAVPPAAEAGKDNVPGIEVGSFTVHPRILVTEIYDNNVFATRNNTVDDFITVVSPSVFIESNFEKHYVNLEAGTDLSSYSSSDRENAQDSWITGDGRIDVTDRFNLFGGAWFSREHEDRESPDDVNGIVPTRYYDTQAHGGASARFGDVALRAGGTFQRLDFHSVPALTGIINNNDRDRDLYTLGARLSYVRSLRLQPFVQASTDVRNYDSNVDDFGFDRASDGYRAAVGARMFMPGRLGLEAFVGYMSQDYDDRRFDDPATPTYGMSLEWLPSPLITVTSYADRTIEETTTFGASSFVYSVFGGAVDWEFRPNFLLNVNGQLGNSDFQGTNRSENLFGGGVGLRYSWTPRLFLEGEYAYRKLDSNLAGQDFDRSLLFLRVGGKL